MKPAGRTPDEIDRLRTLRDAALLDTAPEVEFDDIASLAAQMCRAPIALVSLVDEERQWFKARVGLEAPETARDVSFCGHAILQDDVLVVADALADERFFDNPLVTGEPRVRFYAGAPLIVDGHPLGTLCVIDHVPRELTGEQRRALLTLARHAGTLVSARTRARAQAQANLALDRITRDLAESERRFRLLAENSTDAILALSADLVIRYASPAIESLLGYAPEDVVGKPLGAFYAEVYSPERLEWSHGLRAEGKPYRVENLIRKRDGSTVWTESTVRSVLHPVTREVVEVYGSVRDIAARKAAQEEIDRFFLLSPDMLAVIEGGSFKRVNPAWSHVLGYSEAELLARPVLDFCREVDRERTSAELEQSAMHGAASFESRWVCKDGSVRWFAWTAVASSPEAPVLYAVARDVTDRKAVEKMKNEFVATVSHELRTPLTSIRGSLGLLAGGVVGPLTADAAELVDIARANSDRLIRLVNDILDIEQLDEGRLTLRRAPTYAHDVVDITVRGLSATAEAAGVVVRVEVDAPDPFDADADRLVQVLTNLVSNAIKFSPPGGAVIEVRAHAPAASRIRFSVRDSGPGIPASARGMLFRRFQQLDSSDTRRRGGTGLGLAIAKAIVEQHGGTIGVGDAPSGGAEFFFELPVSAPARAPSEPPEVDLMAELATLRDEYRRTMSSRVVELGALVRAVLASPDRDSLETARVAAHKLHGTAGSYGFALVSEAAGSLEREIERVTAEGSSAAATVALEASLARLEGAT